MRRLIACFMLLVILISSIPSTFAEQEELLSEYAESGINILYVPATELEANRGDYVGQTICTTLYYTDEAVYDNSINATMEAGTSYDFQATFENPDDYADLTEDEPFTVVGMVVPGSAMDFGDVYLYDSHILATGDAALAFDAAYSAPTLLCSGDASKFDIDTILMDHGNNPSSIIGVDGVELKENRDDYVGATVYTVVFFDEIDDDTIYAKLTPAGVFCVDASFPDQNEFSSLLDNDIIALAGHVEPGYFLDLDHVHLSDCHIIAKGIEAQAIMAILRGHQYDEYAIADSSLITSDESTVIPAETATSTDLLSITPDVTVKPTATPVPTPTLVPTPTPTPQPADAGELGEILIFGTYEQDNQTSNGPEPIEWMVIDTSGGKSLLLAVYGLDNRPYNSTRSDVTWATCSLRKWLNDSFLDAAFTSNEQSMILSTELVTEDSYGTGFTFRADGGKNTTDKVFALSVEEVEGLQYDFSYLGFLNTEPTTYASAQGAYTDSTGHCWWWLRSPGASQSMAAISKDAKYGSIEVDDTGVVVDAPSTCVRPAIWVDTEALNAYMRSEPNKNSDDGAPSHTALQRGSKGNEVRALQERLIALGYLADSVDGDFGGKTEAALIAYQQAAGIEATGIYDADTAASLTSEAAPTPTIEPTATPVPTTDPATLVLNRGSKGEDVRQLQLRLIALGFLAGSADGDFGGKTEAALIAYQKAAGLPATGECDYTTFESITSSSAPTAAPTVAPTKKPTNDGGGSTGAYIGNKNTKKFHHSWCSSVDDMKQSNKVGFSSREAAISRGYVPCKRCDP